MKTSEEIMEILEAYDLTGGLRAAAALAGCDHKTVAHHVALREAGHVPGGRPRRATSLDELLPKIEEWVERSKGGIRADVVHQKLVAMGFAGSEREVQRQEPLDTSDLAAADVISTYTVRLNGRTVGEVRHRYGDGAWPLVRAALNLAAETGATP